MIPRSFIIVYIVGGSSNALLIKPIWVFKLLELSCLILLSVENEPYQNTLR